VLTKEEARRVIECMSGVHRLMAKLLYGSGLRLMEWRAAARQGREDDHDLHARS